MNEVDTVERRVLPCLHSWTQGRAGERGSWCCDCGVKVYDVDDRQCQNCAHSRKLHDGTICHKHLMRVTPDMNVTFRIDEGSCWTARHNAGVSVEVPTKL